MEGERLDGLMYCGFYRTSFDVQRRGIGYACLEMLCLHRLSRLDKMITYYVLAFEDQRGNK
jgi:hypothetical protein